MEFVRCKTNSKIDLSGKKFNRLLAVRAVGKNKYKAIVWECVCDCGAICFVVTSHLRRGEKKSCGCLNIETIIKRNTSHGLSHVPEYSVWVKIKDRCNNPNAIVYKHYGARGIKICEEWELSFKTFYGDMGPRPSNRYEIDRMNNDLGYSKSNCRWATLKQNRRNMSTNHILEFNGELKTMTEWSEIFGIPYGNIEARINKLNWSVEDAILKPVRRCVRE